MSLTRHNGDVTRPERVVIEALYQDGTRYRRRRAKAAAIQLRRPFAAPFPPLS